MPLRRPVTQRYVLSAFYTRLYKRSNERSDRKSLINLWRHVIITPIAEKNGFFLIDYTRKGRRVNGWIPKNNLHTVP